MNSSTERNNSGSMYSLFLLLTCFSQFIFGMSLGSKSYTKCEIENDCVLLRDCKSYMNFIIKVEKPLKPSVVDFLREKQCGFQEDYPKVCCSDFLLHDIPTNPNKTSYKICSKKDECIPLKDCKPFTQLVAAMEKPLKQGIVEFLKTQQCGFGEDYPMICCAIPAKTFKNVKHARPHTRPSISKEDDKSSSLEQVIKDIISEVEIKKKLQVKDKKKKAEAFNRAFEMANYFDLAGFL